MHSRVISSFAAALFAASAVYGQVVGYTLIADTSTPVPEATDHNFYGWGATNVAVDASGRVAFTVSLDESPGPSTAAKEGVYLYDSGSITRVADLTMEAPEQGGNLFSRFSTLDIAGARVVFTARAGSTATSLYSYEAGVLTRFYADSVVSGDGEYYRGSGSDPSISGGGVALSSSSYHFPSMTSSYGYYFYDGVNATPLAVNTDVLAGSGGSSPTGFGQQTMIYRDGVLGLWANASGGDASGGVIAAYTAGAGLQLIASTDTAVPGEFTTFTHGVSFGGLSGNQVIFQGGWAGGEGIFAGSADGTLITKLFDLDTLIPGTSDTFEDITDLISNETHVVFEANIGNGEYGIFSLTDGTLHTVVDTTMMLDGLAVSAISLEGLNGLGGDYLGLRVVFEEGGEGLYRYQLSSASAVPEPSTWATILGSGALSFAWWRRRSKRLA